MSHRERREIRNLLKIGSHVQSILDEIYDLPGSSIIICGKNGSGKSLIAINLLKELCELEYSCAFFHIKEENPFFPKPAPLLWMEGLVQCSPADFNMLKDQLNLVVKMGKKVVIFDCLSNINKFLPTGSMSYKIYKEILDYVVSFCKENNLFAIIIEENKSGVGDPTHDWGVTYSAIIENLEGETILFRFTKNRFQSLLPEFSLNRKSLYDSVRY